MKMLIIWCVIYGLSIVHGESTEEPIDDEIVLRMVKGFEARLGEFPYQVALEGNGRQYCGGVIIDAKHVITAAHCIKNYNFAPKDLVVAVGTVELTNIKNPGTLYRVLDVKVHENYKAWNGFANDIALLRLEESIQFGQYVKAAVLPKAGETLNPGQKAIISGFGNLDLKSPPSPKLHKTDVFIVSNSECQKSYAVDRIRSTNICTNNPKRHTGYCQGDSGGPLTVNGKVVGLVSFSLGDGCADTSREPQVYTRLSDYVAWIDKWRNLYNP